MPLETNYATIDEAARQRFEAAWRQARPSDWSPFLPAYDDPRWLATLEELVQIDLELAWKQAVGDVDGATHSLQGGRAGPVVEEYLGKYPELNPPALLLRLVKQEHCMRRRAGFKPDVTEYIVRFPQLEPLVSAAGGWQQVIGKDGVQPFPLPAGKKPSQPDRQPVPTDHEIRGVLGRGGMGIVYEAHEPNLGRTVALKTIRDGQDASPHDRERFLQEARIPARLEHPGIVPVHELVCPELGEPYYTMKLVQGRTLLAAITECHELPPASSARELARHRLLTSFLAVVRTMAFAHSRNVIHRDLKPANIILGNYGETVILDWGLAKVLNEPDSCDRGPALSVSARSAETVTGTVLGTPAYMPPEQAAGEIEKIDARSDIYSLGAILFQILTNRAPASQLITVATLKAGEKPAPIQQRLDDRGISRQLKAICQKAMAYDPGERYPTATALGDDIERYLAGEPVTVCRERLSERFARWGRKHRTLVTAAGVAAILLLIGGALGYAQVIRHRLEREAAVREADAKLKREQHDRELQLASDAERAEALGLAEVESGQFESAALIFAAAAEQIRATPALSEHFERISARQLRLRKIATFYSLWAQAERISAYTPGLSTSRIDHETIAACREGLAELDVLGGNEKWWLRLPANELTAAQRRKLENDAATTLGILALWRVKELVFSISPSSYGEVRSWLSSIKAYDVAHEHPQSAAVEALDRYCRLRMGELSIQAFPLAPNGATDAYYLGTMFLYLDTGMPTEQPSQVKNLFPSALTKVVGAVSPLPTSPEDLMKKLGMDVTNPRAKAGRLLGYAVALEPEHYWAHYWLGFQQRQANQLDAAEQSFNTCVGLRPKFGPAYVERANVLFMQIIRQETELKKEGLAPDDLAAGQQLLADYKQRALEGIENGVLSQPHDAALLWSRAQARAWSGKFSEALVDVERAAALEATRFIAEQRRAEDDNGISSAALDYLKRLKAAQPQHDMTPARAFLSLALDDRTAALDLSNQLLRMTPTHTTGLAVRGALRLRDMNWSGAMADFQQVLQDQRDHPLATLGVAWTYEGAENWQAALVAFDRMLADDSLIESRHDWRELALHLGRARALAALGRRKPAEQALDRARAINPLAASETRAKIFKQN